MNRCTRFCKPLHNHSAIGPPKRVIVQQNLVVNLPFLSIGLRFFPAENRSRTGCFKILLIYLLRILAKRQIGWAGISLVELVMAVALLSLVSLAAVQLLNYD